MSGGGGALIASASTVGELNFLEPPAAESRATVIIPFHDCVIVVCLLHCTQFATRRSKVAQTLDAISGSQFLVGASGLAEAWFLGTV